ncbi:MAG: hypothetical protein P4L40_25735, partial [Terracidiphilus sp.]|nr:hypothetical protein [Terracidiphilus sp.]
MHACAGAGATAAASSAPDGDSLPLPPTVPVSMYRCEDVDMAQRFDYAFDMSVSVEENARRMGHLLYGGSECCCGECGSGSADGDAVPPPPRDAATKGNHNSCATLMCAGLRCFTADGELPNIHLHRQGVALCASGCNAACLGA